MRICSNILIFSLSLMVLACSPTRPATPRETFITYTKAIAKKDVAAMKTLLSKPTLEMHEREAASQGVKIEDVMNRETLFTENQKVVEFKDEKIDGDRATLQVKNSFGTWETVPFVREDGDWKIDKAGYAEQMMRDIEDQQNKTFEQLDNFNGEPQMTETPMTPLVQE